MLPSLTFSATDTTNHFSMTKKCCFTVFVFTHYSKGGRTYLHLESSCVLIIVPHDVGEKSHVVRHS